MDINDLTKLAERFIPQIVKPLAKIADDTARIADHLGSEAGRDRATSLAQLGKVEDNRHLDDFLSSVTLGEINDTLPRASSKPYYENLLNVPIGEILDKKTSEIPLNIPNRSVCLGEAGLRQLLTQIVKYYYNQPQQNIDAKSLEKLVKHLVNSQLVKSSRLTSERIDNIEANLIKTGQKEVLRNL